MEYGPTGSGGGENDGLKRITFPDVGSIDSFTMRESPFLRLFRTVANPRPIFSDLQLAKLRAVNQQFTQADRLCRQAKFNEALPIVQNAVAEAKIVYGTNHPDYVHCLNNLSDIYAEIDDYAHANRCSYKRLKSARQHLGKIIRDTP